MMRRYDYYQMPFDAPTAVNFRTDSVSSGSLDFTSYWTQEKSDVVNSAYFHYYIVRADDGVVSSQCAVEKSSAAVVCVSK